MSIYFFYTNQNFNDKNAKNTKNRTPKKKKKKKEETLVKMYIISINTIYKQLTNKIALLQTPY